MRRCNILLLAFEPIQNPRNVQSHLIMSGEDVNDVLLALQVSMVQGIEGCGFVTPDLWDHINIIMYRQHSSLIKGLSYPTRLFLPCRTADVQYVKDNSQLRHTLSSNRTLIGFVRTVATFLCVPELQPVPYLGLAMRPLLHIKARQVRTPRSFRCFMPQSITTYNYPFPNTKKNTSIGMCNVQCNVQAFNERQFP